MFMAIAQKFNKFPGTIQKIFPVQFFEQRSAGQSRTPCQSSGLAAKGLQIMLYGDDPLSGSIMTGMLSHQLSFIINTKYMTACLNIHMSPHQMIRYRIAVALVRKGGIFIHFGYRQFRTVHLLRSGRQEVLFFIKQFCSRLSRKLLNRPIESLQHRKQPFFGFFQRSKTILQTKSLASDIFHAPLHMTFFIASVKVAEPMRELIVPPQLQQGSGRLFFMGTHKLAHSYTHIVIQHLMEDNAAMVNKGNMRFLKSQSILTPIQ